MVSLSISSVTVIVCRDIRDDCGGCGNSCFTDANGREFKFKRV